jgi:hypothetical protein
VVNRKICLTLWLVVGRSENSPYEQFSELVGFVDENPQHEKGVSMIGGH